MDRGFERVITCSWNKLLREHLLTLTIFYQLLSAHLFKQNVSFGDKLVLKLGCLLYSQVLLCNKI